MKQWLFPNLIKALSTYIGIQCAPLFKLKESLPVQPELLIIGLNFCVVAVAYLSVFPSLAGKNLSKIAYCDLATSAVSLCIVGSVYWGASHSFNLILIDVNWFWFTLITYAIIEVPAYLFYAKYHGISFVK